MEDGRQVWGRKKSWFRGLENVDEEGGEMKMQPSIPQPPTPKEPMEFLSRSWSLSASEISKALALKHKQFLVDNNINNSNNNNIGFPQTNSNFGSLEKSNPPPLQPGKMTNAFSTRRTGSLGRWFSHKEANNINSLKKKDKARLDNARMHASLSVASLAAALAAVAAAENSKGSGSKMSAALASATELLASHCIELAESSGVEHDRVASVVRSAVDIRNPSDIGTLTAAAATALRGETALKARMPKEAKKNATINPYDKCMAEAEKVAGVHVEPEENNPPCIGDLLQHTNKGVLRWKRVSVYINKKSQVMLKIKSKHVGGAFTKNNKCIVYGVCDETSAWPYRKDRDNGEAYFGVKTAQGLLEFKCKNKIHKQKWVDGIQKLIQQSDSSEDGERSLQFISVTKSV